MDHDDGSGLKTYGLTCAHVVLNEELKRLLYRRNLNWCELEEGVRTPIQIHQPFIEDHPIQIGTLKKAFYCSRECSKSGNITTTAGIDVALFELTDKNRLPEDGTFPRCPIKETNTGNSWH